MTHLTTEQLLALREPGAEPGTAAARAHLAGCAACRAELDRLEQRVARLRALPALRPSRDQWPAMQARLAGEAAARRRRRAAVSAAGGLAIAASFAGAFLIAGAPEPEATVAPPAAQVAVTEELEDTKARSQALESAIQQYGAGPRVVDGRTDRLAEELEDRIAEVDRRLDMTELSEAAAREAQLLRLWQERVGLLDALVDVHVTRASNVGL